MDINLFYHHFQKIFGYISMQTIQLGRFTLYVYLNLNIYCNKHYDWFYAFSKVYMLNPQRRYRPSECCFLVCSMNQYTSMSIVDLNKPVYICRMVEYPRGFPSSTVAQNEKECYISNLAL